ncbi:MAG: histidinol dehydrogenase [Dehalococcoidia bacterium]|nr:histidinol dehydrogenase [Dehalococcoidia bacterium]MDW8008821.1 histidinol dehydrogenase [Chloroflexota bacterium]
MRGLRAALEWLRACPPVEEDLPPAVRRRIVETFGQELTVEQVVERVLDEVRREGDAAVARYNALLDGVPEEVPLLVAPQEVEAAYAQVEPQLVEALRQVSERVEAYHRRQLEHAQRPFQADGCGQLVRPLQRVGIYAPGTAVVYPSTVLMIAVPARVAGVEELVMCTPARPDGSVAPVKLVAAHIAGVQRIYRAGGVQAIAALAYGTESIPRADKICGPGNVFVATAKKRLFGQVGIDGLFGPSETVIVADATADPSLVAADLMAGAEHDELATCILIATDEALASAVLQEVEARLDSLARREVARASLTGRGMIAVVDSLEEALELANELAPEHLCLHLPDASAWLGRVRNAGCVFLGPMSAESLGDYAAGPSHVLPTGGSARFSSPLGVWDFLKVTAYVGLSAEEAARLGPAAARVARAEGLTGHALAIEARYRRP